MTNEEAKKMLKAKLECFKNETSGINYDCNMRLCDGCSLNYEQGNMGEQKEALQMAIKALEQTDVLEKIRAEIYQKQYDFMRDGDYDEGIRFGLMLAYQIIDKHRQKVRMREVNADEDIN